MFEFDGTEWRYEIYPGGRDVVNGTDGSKGQKLKIVVFRSGDGRELQTSVGAETEVASWSEDEIRSLLERAREEDKRDREIHGKG